MAENFRLDDTLEPAGSDPLDAGSDTAPDAFEQALAEYQAGEPEPKAAAEPPAQAEQQHDTDEILSRLPAELRRELEDRYHSGWAHLTQVAQAVAQERDRQDGQRLYDLMRAEFPDLSETVLKSMLVARYHGDPHTSTAWDNRYENKAGWARELGRIRSDLAAETARSIDHEQTDTRAAIAAWMTRGSSGSRREPEAADTTSMTDAEYRQHVKTEFGYTPKVG